MQKENSAQIIHHSGSHVVGKYWLEYTPRRLKIKEDEMCAEKLTYDVMHILKCATMDSVLAKKSDSDNMTSEELRKVLANQLCRKNKVMQKS